MISRRVLFYRLYLVTNIAIIWVLFSLVLLYNIVQVDREVLEKRRLSFFSLAFAMIGFIVAGAETFFLKDAFRRFPLWLSTILRMALTFLLFCLVSILFLLAYYFIRYDGSFLEFEHVFIDQVLLTPSFMMLMVDMGLMAFLSILILEISDKYGPGGIRNLLRGRYNKPRKENRIFVFLDINDSTTIAERIGHDKYFNMLKDFFADITEPILANGGHIYQYVGDEVVICWINTPANKRRCLKFLKQATLAIKRKEKYYLSHYEVAPSFKAGIHAGDVTAGYIGIVKKDLVFSGDTLNTTARIRSKCHDLKKPFVASNEFLQDFRMPHPFTADEIGEISLKGREEKEKLFAVTF